MVIPFRLINILVLFQEIINHILYKYLNIFIIVYLNNILIFLETLKEYKRYIK
jgi:hypothetical protein